MFTTSGTYKTYTQIQIYEHDNNSDFFNKRNLIFDKHENINPQTLIYYLAFQYFDITTLNILEVRCTH